MAAFEDWAEVYSSTYSTEELETELATLKANATFYTSQQEGGTSYTKELSEIRARLKACARALGSSSSRAASRVGFADFSGL